MSGPIGRVPRIVDRWRLNGSFPPFLAEHARIYGFVLPADRNVLGRLIPHAHLTVVPDAGHFVFMPVCSEAGRFIAAPVCVDTSPSVDRTAVHERAAAHAVEFFGRSLGVR